MKEEYRHLYLWVEDECTRGLPGHVNIVEAFAKFFPRQNFEGLWGKAKELETDYGDAYERPILPGVVAGYSVEGAFIYKLVPLCKIRDGLKCSNCLRLQTCRIMYGVKSFSDTCISRHCDFEERR